MISHLFLNALFNCQSSLLFFLNLLITKVISVYNGI